jgi:hypothetical protein
MTVPHRVWDQLGCILLPSGSIARPIAFVVTTFFLGNPNTTTHGYPPHIMGSLQIEISRALLIWVLSHDMVCNFDFGDLLHLGLNDLEHGLQVPVEEYLARRDSLMGVCSSKHEWGIVVFGIIDT